MAHQTATKITAQFKLKTSNGKLLHEGDTLSIEYSDTLDPITHFILEEAEVGSQITYDISGCSRGETKRFFSFINHKPSLLHMLKRDIIAECHVIEIISPQQPKKSKLQSRIEQMRKDLGLDPTTKPNE